RSSERPEVGCAVPASRSPRDAVTTCREAIRQAIDVDDLPAADRPTPAVGQLVRAAETEHARTPGQPCERVALLVHELGAEGDDRLAVRAALPALCPLALAEAHVAVVNPAEVPILRADAQPVAAAREQVEPHAEHELRDLRGREWRREVAGHDRGAHDAVHAGPEGGIGQPHDLVDDAGLHDLPRLGEELLCGIRMRRLAGEHEPAVTRLDADVEDPGAEIGHVLRADALDDGLDLLHSGITRSSVSITRSMSSLVL